MTKVNKVVTVFNQLKHPHTKRVDEFLKNIRPHGLLAPCQAAMLTDPNHGRGREGDI